MSYATAVKIKGGLVGKEVDPGLIAEVQSPNMQNVTKYTDSIGQRPGREAYGSIQGIPMVFYHFKISDTNRFIAITTSKIYYRGASGWTDVTGTDLSGTLDDYVDICTVYDGTASSFYTVFTNGKNNMRKFDGTNDTSDMSAWTAVDPRFVRYYQGYLVGGNNLVSGTRRGFTWQCSDTDNPNDITGTNARQFNLTKDRGASDIMRIEHFGNYLLFYKTDCIYGAWLGSTKNIFEFDVWIHNVGLKASRALAIDGEGGHFFLGPNDFYYWAGRNSRPQGLATERIRRRVFEDTDPTYLKRSWCEYDPRYNQVRLYVPESTFPQTVYALDLGAQQWTWWQDELSNITAVGKYARDVIVTIDDLTGTIDNLTGTIDELSGAPLDNFPNVLEGKSDGSIQYASDSKYDDDTTAIDSYYDTNDYIWQNDAGEPFSYERVQGIRVECKAIQSSGDRLYVYYSTDEGSTWTAITGGYDDTGTAWSDYISLTTAWRWFSADFDTVCQRVRIRFRNAQGTSTWRVRKLELKSRSREQR